MALNMSDRVKAGPEGIVKPADLTRQIQVIGAGFGRTGTMSMTVALEKLLDGPCYHTATMVLADNKENVKNWTKITRPSCDPALVNLTLKTLLAGYVGVTDTLGAVFTPELLELYPEAIVICTTRETEAWWKSFSTLRGDVPEGFDFKTFVIDMVMLPYPKYRLWNIIVEALREKYASIYNLPGPKAIPNKEFMNHHITWLKRVVPPERLHFFDVKQGWEPLCKILNVPIPDEAFPRANEQASMAGLGDMLVSTIKFRWAVIFGILAVSGMSWYRFW